MKFEKYTEVIKASPAIQIQSKITLLQRRAWNVMLAHAYHDLPIKNVHRIGIADLADKLGFQHKNANQKYLKAALRALRKCEVEWNVLHKDKTKEWGVAGLFAEVRIHENICYYQYPHTLQLRLYNPHIYTRLNLQLQNKFTSRYGLTLWEVCFDYFDLRRDEGETPVIDLDVFRKLMGLEHHEYPLFKELNRNVIKPALKEINAVTCYNVAVEQRRVGRRIGELKFRITRVKTRSAQQVFYADMENLPRVAAALIRAEVDRKFALKIADKEWDFVNPEKMSAPGVYPDFMEYIKEKVAVCARASDVKNPGGYIVEAIRENYRDKVVKTAHQQRVKKSKQKELQFLCSEYNKKRDAIIHKVIEAKPDLLAAAAEKVKRQFVLERLWEYDSPVQAYEGSNVVKAELRSIVEAEFCTDLMTPLYQEYEEEKVRIAGLPEPRRKGRRCDSNKLTPIRKVMESIVMEDSQEHAR